MFRFAGEKWLLPLLLAALGMSLTACKSAPLAPDEGQLLDTMSTPDRPEGDDRLQPPPSDDQPEPAGESVEPGTASEGGESGETGETADAPDGSGADDGGEGDGTGETGEGESDRPAILDPAKLPIGPNGVPAIPQPRWAHPIIVDENRIFATVNGEVISSRDVRRDIEDYLANIAAATIAGGFGAGGGGEFNPREWNELRQNFRRKALLLLYSQEARSFRKRGIGSIPREAVEQAIADARERHGIRGTTPEDEEEWRRVLERNNMTYFDFEQKMREQLEAGRVRQLYAFHPEMRLGVSFNVSPEEMRKEYERNPIRATTDIVVHLVKFPLLVESGDQREAQEKRAAQFVEELKGAFAAVERTPNLDGVQANEARRAAFVELASSYSPDFEPEPKTLDNLNDEKPEYAAEIRRTRVGQASRLIAIPREEMVLIFVVNKKQAGFEPFSSPAVQKELSRRLLNQRWNDFQGMVDRELIDKSTIISAEAGGLDE